MSDASTQAYQEADAIKSVVNTLRGFKSTQRDRVIATALAIITECEQEPAGLSGLEAQRIITSRPA